ncbi:MAG: alpha/beta fold hydrolase [Solirubrobacterales bacterium]
MPEFTHRWRQIVYEEYGSGDRPIVLVHGLLMNRRMFDRLAPALAERGNRVITIDLLGHGRSDRPPEMVNYSMTRFAEQVVALLDHLGIGRAVVGGTSLGANVALETVHAHPDRVEAIFCEMPVLDNALIACGAIFTPLMIGMRLGTPLLRPLAAVVQKVPRSNQLLDIGLDWIRQDPEPSVSVLEGLFLGRIAPNHDERVLIKQPALVIGHQGDPLHPFSDSGMLADELPNSRVVTARTIMEWRLRPERLDEELAAFLEEVWGPRKEAFDSVRRNGVGGEGGDADQALGAEAGETG